MLASTLDRVPGPVAAAVRPPRVVRARSDGTPMAGTPNGALARLIAPSPPAPRRAHPSVQRCGAIPAASCACHDGGDADLATGAGEAPVAQRQPMLSAAVAARSATSPIIAGRPGTVRAARRDSVDLLTLPPSTIAQLQQSAGNAAVTALLDRLAPSAGAAPPTRGGVTPSRGRPAASRVVQRAVTREQAGSIADKLHDAMAGWGTDEDAIYAALGGRTGPDIVAIRNAYRRYGDLDADLADELDDDELARVRELMPPVADETSLPRERREEAAVDRARVIASQLKDAMEGLGTDEDSIFAALSGRTQDEVGEIKRQYLELTGRYLERDLQDELSGEDLRRAFNLLDTAGEFDRVGFSECDPTIREKLRAFVPIARSKVAAAIAALQPGWAAMSGRVKSSFQTYFDPGNSGQIDGRFVELVLDNFRQISAYMAEGLDFDCELTSGSICGDGVKWCGPGAGNGRLYWTCFGDIHVCANAGWTAASDERRWSDIIHESTHNALHTTDRVYCGRTGWTELTPYGTGFGSAMMNVPVFGIVARLAGGGGDTLHNPDSYSHFAQER